MSEQQNSFTNPLTTTIQSYIISLIAQTQDLLEADNNIKTILTT